MGKNKRNSKRLLYLLLTVQKYTILGPENCVEEFLSSSCPLGARP
jgi:hypothetical protein